MLTDIGRYLAEHGHLPPEVSAQNLPAPRKFLCGDDLKATTKKLATHSGLITSMALRGVDQHVIAAAIGVSRETINRRLRKAGIVKPKGRPKKYIKQMRLEITLVLERN